MRCVAGAGFHPDRQVHFLDGRFHIARHIHGQSFQRRDIERVQPLLGSRGEIDERGQKSRQRLAGAGRGDQQHVAGDVQQQSEVNLRPAESSHALEYDFDFAGLFDTRVAAATLGMEAPGLAAVLQALRVRAPGLRFYGSTPELRGYEFRRPTEMVLVSG